MISDRHRKSPDLEDAAQAALAYGRTGRRLDRAPRPERESMSDRPVFLYAAIYDEIADAEGDYEAVFDLHSMERSGPLTRR
jgi:hypothetical protein